MIYTVTLNPVLDRTMSVTNIQFNEILRTTQVHVDAGGKGFNVSRALKLLGLGSTALGFVGGAVGEQLERSLHNLGITTDFVIIAGETRTNTVILEEQSDRYLKVNEPGPSIQISEQMTLIEKVRALVRSGDTWILSGSLPPGCPADSYAVLIELIKSNTARVLLDASGLALTLGCKASPFLVKPNLDEAGQAFGRSLTTQSDLSPANVAVNLAIDFFLSCGIEFVALSGGADGLWLANQQSRVHAIPPKITARNPVGTGDALLAGLVYAFSRNLPLREIARWGTACGTAAAMASGVNFGTLAEVEAVYKKVIIQ